MCQWYEYSIETFILSYLFAASAGYLHDTKTATSQGSWSLPGAIELIKDILIIQI